MDMELELLREAALISMEEKQQQQQQVDELAALREAALDSARERKLSSDPLGKRRHGSMEGLGKRRLESPPSHHYGMRRGSGGYESYSDSENSGNLTPKITADDSIKHTPPRCDPVFTVKMTDNMLLKRNNSHRTSSSNSNISDKSLSPKTENKITVQLRNTKTSDSESEKALSDKSTSLPHCEKFGNNHMHKSPSLSTTPPVKVPIVADVSPVLSKVSSVEDVNEQPQSKKQKKKHKKKKSSSKTKKPKQKVEVESSSEDEKAAKKSHSNNHKSDKKANGASTRREKIKAAEARLEKLQSEFKQQVISENIISKIDKNIELLQNAKKSKHENKKSHPPKKIISEEISSNEEEELLKSDKRKSNSSPRKRDRKRLKNSNSRRRSKSPSSPVDVSVSLKSKREFEQMKAELNKKASKSEKKEPSKQSPRKESRLKGTKEVANSPPKQENKTSAKSENSITPPAVQDAVKQDNGTKPVDMDISEKEEQELLGDVKPSPKNTTPLQPPPVAKTKLPDDFVSVMKEDSFSDSDQESDKVNVSSDKKLSAENKRRKSKKSKKKKGKEEKAKRKKKRRKHASDSSDSDDSDNHEKKKKVKIDKSELNKIVQFLKQRDEAQKSQDPKTTFNPKIISKEAKPIEIKLKSKPKR